MTTLTPAVPATAIAAKVQKRATLPSFALLALSVGVTFGFAYTQFGQARFAPTFAKELTQASEQHRAAGDHQAALAASRKATEVYRRLMGLSAMHYAPYLAASLHDLSVRLGDIGDNTGARAAIDEAITIRRQLAKANPVRYQTGLEQSMQQLAQIEAVSRGDFSMLVNAANWAR